MDTLTTDIEFDGKKTNTSSIKTETFNKTMSEIEKMLDDVYTSPKSQSDNGYETIVSSDLIKSITKANTEHSITSTNDLPNMSLVTEVSQTYTPHVTISDKLSSSHRKRYKLVSETDKS